MRIIYNDYFPWGDFHGINLFGVVFVKRRWGRFLPHEVRHEAIHTRQQRELLFFLFFLCYGVEYVARLFLCGFDAARAYRSVSFEREAYANEGTPEYLRYRRPYAWTRYLW